MEPFLIFIIVFHINHALTHKIEYTFIEIINTKKADIVVCCVFNDPKMDVTEYNSHLKEMPKKVFKEQKKIFFLGDFNFNLLKYNMRLFVWYVMDFLDSYSIIPYNLQPTRFTSSLNTLIYNSFFNLFSCEKISRNLTATISDCLPRLFICF